LERGFFLGLLCGAASIGGGLAISLMTNSLHLPIWLSPEALLVVFGGTLAATMVSYPLHDIASTLRGIGRAQRAPDSSVDYCIQYISEVAQYVRNQSILALQPILDSIEIPFLRNGLQLLMDNQPEASVQHILSAEIALSHRLQMNQAQLVEAAGGYAPTMGIVGAVIGLIQTLHHLKQPEQLTHGVASAFIATLYGVALANLLLLPLATRIRQRAHADRFEKLLLLEGLLSIARAEHPTVTADKLQLLAEASRGDAMDDEYERHRSYGVSGLASNSALNNDIYTTNSARVPNTEEIIGLSGLEPPNTGAQPNPVRLSSPPRQRPLRSEAELAALLDSRTRR
jgi:chemotaxis protein MotA